MAGRAMAPPKKKAGGQAAPQQDPVSLEERIRVRAHEIYLQRNGAAGDEVEDWLQAESEIRSADLQA